MTYAQSALALAIILILPLLDLPTLLRLKRYTSSPARLHAYRAMLVILWAFTAAALLITPLRRMFLLPSAPGDPAWVTGHSNASTGILGAAAALLIVTLVPGLLCLLSPAVRLKYAASTKSMRFLLPVSVPERRLWILVCLSAGICEEILYRGFLLAWLRGLLSGGPHLPIIAALVLSSLAFGGAHSYQGVLGVLQTSVIGVAFALLALLSHSLIAPVVLHALIDLQVLAMYRPAADAPDQAAALLAGCDPATSTL